MFANELLEKGEEIVNLVRQRWLRGQRPDGSIIGEYKDFGYRLLKRSQNPLAGGNVDLTLDGPLNENLVLNHLRGSFFNIFSDDSKAVSIAERYGLDVYGLTPEETKLVLERAKEMTFIKIYKSIFK